MTVTTLLFAALVAVVWVVYWLLPPGRRVWAVLGGSLVFYVLASPTFVVPMVSYALLVLWAGRTLGERPGTRKWLLVLGVSGVVLVLAAFKYAQMGALTANPVLARVGLDPLAIPQWAAPLGISFVTFGVIRYLVQCHRGEARAAGPTEFVSFVLFFPTITAGPIKLYNDFIDDTHAAPRGPSAGDLSYGAWRILIGLFKKNVVAELAAVVAAPLHKSGVHGDFMLLVAIWAYALQIYFDFAGYSDIAIGVSRLFGYTIVENFAHPYLKPDIGAFWRAWHMSLTRFLTEFVYIPLGGSRKGAVRTFLNTVITFLVSGLWHGAAWHFVAWGLWHGIGVAVQRPWGALTRWLRARVPTGGRFLDSRAGSALSYALGVALTFNFVALGWVLFIKPVPEALAVYKALYYWVRDSLGAMR